MLLNYFAFSNIGKAVHMLGEYVVKMYQNFENKNNNL